MDVENLINKRLVNNEPVFSAYLHARAEAKGVPVSGTFELTSRCNFNCRMCYVHNMDCSKMSEEKPAEWWINLGKKAASEGVVFLLITGGEPLLRKDFKEIYTELSKLGLMISINTNGSLLCGEIAELFKKIPPTRLNISLYGASDETYEKFTGAPYFTKVLDNIKLLKSYGVDIRLNVSITEDITNVKMFSNLSAESFKKCSKLAQLNELDSSEFENAELTNITDYYGRDYVIKSNCLLCRYFTNENSCESISLIFGATATDLQGLEGVTDILKFAFYHHSKANIQNTKLPNTTVRIHLPLTGKENYDIN
jgi:sulfatase maturation enzyme AslB (radical SAM superfamily)